MTARADFDLLVVGGGINGAGIARDAAGRGLRVLLCERDDLAAHTSSGSTKLVHGGLRYLEHYDFGLVRKALQEREVLLEAAPHVIWPLRFVMPHDAHLRPAWMIRAGLLLYDHLARRRRLPASGSIDLRRHPAGAPLDARYTQGFVYSDAWVEDSRLVALNALDARERGAEVLTRTTCTALRRDARGWSARLERGDGTVREVSARAVVNAAGPWAAAFLDEAVGQPATAALRLVKGSHIVVRRLFEHEFAYIFQAPDRRIVFAIPYEQDFTLVGTTDVEYSGDPARVAIDQDEVRYLLDMIRRCFARELDARDVVWHYSAVRPLLEDEAADPSAVTRDYQLKLDDRGAPLLSVFGGKITTFRKLAEEAVDRIVAALGESRPAWTARAALPGGDLPGADFEAFLVAAATRYPFLPAPLLRRLARAYGTRIERLIGDARSLTELGEAVLPGLYAREVEYLREQEWVASAADLLWRRSKLGLHLPADAEVRLQRWLEEHPR
jgi:glycerol-3-phosphate dehydrogenase